MTNSFLDFINSKLDKGSATIPPPPNNESVRKILRRLREKMQCNDLTITHIVIPYEEWKVISDWLDENGGLRKNACTIVVDGMEIRAERLNEE